MSDTLWAGTRPRNTRKRLANFLCQQQINQLQEELEQLEEAKKKFHARMAALCCQDTFESLLKEQLQRVVVSGGIVSEVAFV